MVSRIIFDLIDASVSALARSLIFFVESIYFFINKESEDAFSKGKTVFSFNGSWSVNVYKQLSPDLNYSFFSLPKASAEFPVRVWGGAGSSFMVSEKSAQKEQAVKFLAWLTSKEQQRVLIQETNNLPGCIGGGRCHLGYLQKRYKGRLVLDGLHPV